MILTLDIGNTKTFGGVFDKGQLKARFRNTSKDTLTSDELGIFLKAVLREHKINPDKITQIGISSVVPDLLRTVINCCIKYFGIEPFILEVGVKTGLKINTSYGDKLGADRVADIMGAMHKYPSQNLIVLDFGTANTYDAVSKNKEYMGGAITVGVGVALNALCQNTALLSKVEIARPSACAGNTTQTQLQSGLYYGTLGATKEFIFRFKKECFKDEPCVVIGTGGMGRMFEHSGVFDCYDPDLVLKGIYLAIEMNGKNCGGRKKA